MSNNKHEFRSDVRKVLSILTHSLYSNREIFLRELLSNASDALEKMRFLQSKSSETTGRPLEIRINMDKEKGILTITDTGIGMTEQEMEENLGTIARSGSEEFLKELNAENIDKENFSQIIGRFGIGFYSVFMVADYVEVISTHADDSTHTPHFWASNGEGSFILEEYKEGNAPKRGTMIVVRLKESATQYLDEQTIEQVIRTHSSFLPFPIYIDDKKFNTSHAIWREPKSAITQEQYNELYTYLTYDNEHPLATIHFSADSPIQFNLLAFIPNDELDLALAQREQYGLDLYARRVLISRDNKDLVPNYLAFLKGVVDTEDLPLNISRETLQENVVIRKISQSVTKRTLKHLEKLAKDEPEIYEKFWKIHSKIFKIGYSDYLNRESFINLIRFNSSRSETVDELISLEEYVAKAKEKHEDKQKVIWYIVGSNREACKLHPLYESFQRRELEVLFLYEPIDEIMLESLMKYEEYAFKSVEFATEEDLKDFPEAIDGNENPPLKEEDKPDLDKLIELIKSTLKEQIKDVRLSARLASAPACLVGADGASSSLEKLLKVMHKDSSIPQKIFEINPNHPLIKNMLTIYQSNNEDAMLPQMIITLFESSQLRDGYVQDPHLLASRINELLQKSSAWYTEIKR